MTPPRVRRRVQYETCTDFRARVLCHLGPAALSDRRHFHAIPGPVLWAIMLTRMAYPLYRRTYQLLNGRASLAAALVTTGIMLLGVLPVVYLTFLLVQQSIVAYMATSAWIEHGGLKQLPQYLDALPVGGSTMQEQIGRYI